MIQRIRLTSQCHLQRSRWLTWSIALALVLGLTSQSLGRPETELHAVEAKVGARQVESRLLELANTRCTSHFSHLSLKACMQNVWTPRWQLEAEAAERQLDETPSFRFKADDLLHRELVRRVQAGIDTPTKAEIDDFIAAHPRDFQKPLRIRIFRILLAEEEEARELIAGFPRPLDIKTFRALARQHSVDGATKERGGDLGFVWPDGSTDIPQIHVEPDLYKAALPLEDGQWVSEPVAEGERFAVLWRRGSLAAVPTRGAARQLARTRLIESRAADRVERLLSRLVQEQVRDRNDVLLGKLRRKDTGMFQEPSH